MTKKYFKTFSSLAKHLSVFKHWTQMSLSVLDTTQA